MKFPLGRFHSAFDERDYNLRSFIPRLETDIKESNWEFPLNPLDQGETGHCVGFSMANFGINDPTCTPYDNENAHAFYYRCKEIDGQPRNENGSTIRSAAKAMLSLNMINAYAFASDMAALKWWLLNKGPVIVGTIWTMDMFLPDANNVIHPSGSNAGGHAYLLNEWRIDNFIGIQNSWGEGWGKKGKAYISAVDFEKLFVYDGEALTAVEITGQVDPDVPIPPATNTGCGAKIQAFRSLFK